MLMGDQAYLLFVFDKLIMQVSKILLCFFAYVATYFE